MRRGDRKHKPSATRSETMTGRPSLRKGERQLPRQSLTVGLVKRPAPDPTKKPWPTKCVLIVAASPATFRPSQIRGQVIDKKCRECGARLCVDSFSIDELFNNPIRQGRPIEYLGVDCCFANYETAGVQMLRSAVKSEGGDSGE
jgi:hypothetical protein